MFSEMVREALGRELIGQEVAVNSVARGLTRLASGLTPSERSWCAYLLVGPTGTGRGHLVRSLSRLLHPFDTVLTVHCRATGHVDPWTEFVQRLEPLVAPHAPGPTPPGFAAPGQAGSSSGLPGELRGLPPRLVLVQDLERAHKVLFPELAHLLESGHEVLPDGRCLSLDGCMLFFTTGICTDQILDHARIGFSGTRENDGEERGSLDRICREEAANAFGLELLGQFDDLLVFQRLGNARLSEVLDLYFARVSRWLGGHDIRCELLPAAKAHLLELVGGERQPAVHDLVRIHRDFVEFPVADLLVSGALGPGSLVRVDHRAGDRHLYFSVEPREPNGLSLDAVRRIPVTGNRPPLVAAVE